MVDPNKARLKSCKDTFVVSTARKYVAKAKNFRNFCLKRSRLPRGAKSVIKKWTPKQGDMSYHIPKQAMKDVLIAEWLLYEAENAVEGEIPKSVGRT